MEYLFWLPLVLFLLGMLIVFVGIFAGEKTSRFGWGIVLVSVISTVGIMVT